MNAVVKPGICLAVLLLFCLPGLVSAKVVMATGERQILNFGQPLLIVGTLDPKVATARVHPQGADVMAGDQPGSTQLLYQLQGEQQQRRLTLQVQAKAGTSTGLVATDLTTQPAPRVGRPAPAVAPQSKLPDSAPLASSPQDPQTTARVKLLTVGEQYVLQTPRDIERTASSSDAVISANAIQRRQLLVTAHQLGEVDLRVWLEGQRQPSLYQFRVTPEAQGLDPEYTLSQVDGRAVMRGETQALDRHHRNLQAFPEAIDHTFMAGALQVQTDIRIVEVNRRRLMNSGFFAGQAGSTPFALGGSTNVLSFLSGESVTPNAEGFSLVRANSSGVFSALSVLSRNGFAQVLAEPSLVSLSGHSASFLSGGEFPFPRSNANGDISVEFREFGVRLQLTPIVLDQHRIQLTVAPEVSEPDFSRGLQTGGVLVPALNTRRTETTVQIGDGESFIISGLISRNLQQNIDKIPGLGDLPFLGAFFRSTRYELEEKELIMIVTPSLVSPIAPGVDLGTLPGEFLQDYQPNFFELFVHPSSAERIQQGGRFGFAD